MEIWDGSKAATEIFKFFGIKNMLVPKMGEGEFRAEGIFGRKLLCVFFTVDGNDFCVQFRDRKSGRDRGGAIIRECNGMRFIREDGEKLVFIDSPHGYVELDKFGVHCDLGATPETTQTK
ncbi:MAG: hypothetical protein WAP23_00025 [Candidatus Spechtbacterales bacterium]